MHAIILTLGLLLVSLLIDNRISTIVDDTISYVDVLDYILSVEQQTEVSKRLTNHYKKYWTAFSYEDWLGRFLICFFISLFIVVYIEYQKDIAVKNYRKQMIEKS